MLNRKEAPPFLLPNTGLALLPQKEAEGIYSFTKPGLEVFKLDLVFPLGGIGNELKHKTQSICCEMLMSGTINKSAQEINEILDFYGSYVNIATDYYKSVLTVYGLNEYFEEIIQILKEILTDSNFPEKEWKMLQQQKIQRLRIQQKKTSYQSRKLMNKQWYGTDSILGCGTEEQDYLIIKQEDICQAYSANFKEGFIILSSGEKVYEMAQMLSETQLLNFNKESYQTHPISFKKMVGQESVYLIPESNQSSLLARLEIPNRHHSDYPALSMINVIFGGYFGSKLMKNIREDKGWTYGVQSHIRNHQNSAYLEISADIKSDKVKDTIQEIDNEVKLLLEKGFSEQEWFAAKNYYIGNIQRSLDNFMNHADRYISLKETNSNINDYNDFIQKVSELSPNDVNEVAHTYFASQAFLYVWSGPE